MEFYLENIKNKLICYQKTDPEIYEFLLIEMELPATSIIFVDGREENIEAAQKLGFDAIFFTSQTQLQKELKKRGLFG